MINEYFTPMKRTLLLFSLACALMAHARVIYLNTGGSALWNQSEAVFFCQSWGGNAAKQDIELTKVNASVYSAEISDSDTKVMFLRLRQGATSIETKNVLNQTAVLSLSPDYDMYTITGWGETEGSWSQADEVLKRAVKSNLPLEYNPEKLNPSDAW